MSLEVDRAAPTLGIVLHLDLVVADRNARSERLGPEHARHGEELVADRLRFEAVRPAVPEKGIIGIDGEGSCSQRLGCDRDSRLRVGGPNPR